MYKIHITILVLLSVLLLNAQQVKESKFGKFTTEELEMTTCEYDKSADAVILSDYGESEFLYKGTQYFIASHRHKRIKLLKEAGFEYGTITIPYYTPPKGRKEEVNSIKAFTYLIKDGEIVERKALDKKLIFTEKVNKNWSQKKFVFPNLKEGAILEFSYDHYTPYIFTIPEWRYQHSIPTMYSQFKVSVIPAYDYVSIHQGIDQFDYQNDYVTKIGEGQTVYIFAKKNSPAFKDESFITSVNDYIMKTKFQLSSVKSNNIKKPIITTWSKLNKEVNDHDKFGKYIKKSKKLSKNLLSEIPLEGLTQAQKIEVIVDYVKTSFIWNKSNAKYASQSAKKFLKSKTGNSADINLFLIGMLQQAEIDARPVLLSTRGHGKIQTLYPFESSLNYVCVLINGQVPILTDGTSKFIKYDNVPPYCVNDIGLLINKKGDPDWLKIQQNQLSTSKKIFFINVDSENDELNINFINTSDMYTAYNVKNLYENDPEKIKEGYEDLSEDITDIKTKNYDNSKGKYTFSFKATNTLERLNDYIVVKPFLNQGITKNFFTQEERKYPVDMIYPRKNTLHSTISIPDGYKLSELPEVVAFNDETMLFSIVYKLDPKGTKLSVKCDYVFKQSVYESDLYPTLKKNIDILVENINKEIVLEPK